MKKFFLFTLLWLTQTVPAHAAYAQNWLVTWYGESGRMADGAWTHWGAAACGNDVPLETRIWIHGVGIFRCQDRMGYLPWHHADVWGRHWNVSNRLMRVTIWR